MVLSHLISMCIMVFTYIICRLGFDGSASRCCKKLPLFFADIESKLRQIEEDPEGAGTAHLHQVTQNISAVANHAFEPLFERQVEN